MVFRSKIARRASELRWTRGMYRVFASAAGRSNSTKTNRSRTGDDRQNRPLSLRQNTLGRTKGESGTLYGGIPRRPDPADFDRPLTDAELKQRRANSRC
jgi:hypothetical protein